MNEHKVNEGQEDDVTVGVKLSGNDVYEERGSDPVHVVSAGTPRGKRRSWTARNKRFPWTSGQYVTSTSSGFICVTRAADASLCWRLPVLILLVSLQGNPGQPGGPGQPGRRGHNGQKVRDIISCV